MINKILFPFSTLIFTILTVGTMIAYDKLGGMDFFKEKCGFIEAAQALKNGKTIRRAKSYSRIYTSAEINIKGKQVRQFGNISDHGSFSPGIRFDEDDFTSEDWIIEGKDKP